MAVKPKTETVPVIVGKAYDFVFWLIPKVEGFDKKYKFTVGERLSANGLDLLTTLVEAAYSRDKANLLQEATRKINSTRFLLRLSKDLHLMSIESYGFSLEKLEEIGRMAGGWQKSAVQVPR